MKVVDAFVYYSFRHPPILVTGRLPKLLCPCYGDRKEFGMFKSTHNHGTHVTFPNGYTVSAQWGEMNYCERHGGFLFGASLADDMTTPVVSCQNCELAVWHENGTWYTNIVVKGAGVDCFVEPVDEDDDRSVIRPVACHVTPTEYAKILAYVASLD
jgi:hypothetical protein